MEFINATRMQAGFTLGVEPSGRELLVVVIKGSFQLPAAGEPVTLHDVQQPLVMADTYSGEPGLSAPVLESDFAPRKRYCDVLLRGSAHAPGGRPVTQVTVGLQVGPLSKTFRVVGNRRWDCSLTQLRATPPEPFVTQPLGYDVAFGGVDQHHPDPAQHAAFMRNPAGRGFHHHLRREWVDGQALPNTEQVGRSVTSPEGPYLPMDFGPLGRSWEPRAQYAGTYDDAWRDEHFPFLPPDFDERYHQAAPSDQWMALPDGDVPITLHNLTPEGLCHFTLPHFEAPVYVTPVRGEREDHRAVLDTILIEPDEHRVCMTWRLTRPLRRSLFDIEQVVVGRKGREWWQQREQVVAFPLPVIMVPADTGSVAARKLARATARTAPGKG